MKLIEKTLKTDQTQNSVFAGSHFDGALYSNHRLRRGFGGRHLSASSQILNQLLSLEGAFRKCFSIRWQSGLSAVLNLYL
jgi:hypothetical protein